MTMIEDTTCTTCIAMFIRDGSRPGQTHARGDNLSVWLDDAEADAALHRLADDDDGDDFRTVVDAFIGGKVQTIAFPMGY